MIRAWHPEEKKAVVPEPVSLFLQAINKDVKWYNEHVYERLLHCMNCGLPVCSITNRVVYAVDNPGLPMDMLTGYGYVEIRCKRCKQPYRIFV